MTKVEMCTISFFYNQRFFIINYKFWWNCFIFIFLIFMEKGARLPEHSSFSLNLKHAQFKFADKRKKIHFGVWSEILFEVWSGNVASNFIYGLISSFPESITMKRVFHETKPKWMAEKNKNIGIQPHTQIVNVPKQLLFALTFAKLNFVLLYFFHRRRFNLLDAAIYKKNCNLENAPNIAERWKTLICVCVYTSHLVWWKWVSVCECLCCVFSFCSVVGHFYVSFRFYSVRLWSFGRRTTAIYCDMRWWTIIRLFPWT